MFDKLDDIERRFHEVETLLSDRDVAKDSNKLRDLGKEHAELSPIVAAYREYKRLDEDLTTGREMLSASSGDDATLMRDEITELEEKLQKLDFQLKEMLIPKDPN